MKQALEDAFIREKYDEITASLNEANDGKSCPEPEIRDKVRAVLRNAPIVAIPIDGTTQDLVDFANVLKPRVWIWHVRKWADQNGEVIYEVPSEEEREIDTEETPEQSEQRRTRAGVSLTDLLRERILQPGQKLVKNYKGKTFEATITQEGKLKIGNDVFEAPSPAAVSCIQSTGSKRKTEDGWKWWANQLGITLDALREEYSRKSAIADDATHVPEDFSDWEKN